MATVTYDFAAFFKNLDPVHDYTFEKCSGGLVNLTVRAIRVFSPQSLSASITDGPLYQSETLTSSREFSKIEEKSFIVKYAPPYFASIGETAPFSQHRQVVESSALAMLGSSSGTQCITSSIPGSGALHEVAIQSNVAVPRLYGFFPEEHIIIMQDLGDNLKTLEELMQDVSNSDSALITMRNIGEEIGRFMGLLHSYDSSNPSVDADTFKSDHGSADFIKEFIIDTIPPFLRSLGLAEEFHTESLRARVARSYTGEDDQIRSIPQAFSIGDFWPNSVLIKATGQIGIIDWEFASFASPLQDMAQMAAHLHLLLIASDCELAKKNICTFVQSMHSAHRQAGVERASPWIHTDSPSHVAVVRAAWLLHGREMINNAVERDWPNCIPRDEDGSFKTCPKRAEMARTGAWYIDAAGEDVEDMRRNWSKVIREGFLRPLYLPA